MPKLTGPQMGQLQQAMLDAFTIQELGSLLLFRLDKQLTAITSSQGNLKEAILDVIMAAGREGWIGDLLRAVSEERPALRDLQALIVVLLAQVEGAGPAPVTPPATAPVSRPPATTTPATEPGRPTVFISYSHADEAWKDRLVKQLDVLEDVLIPWDDRKIGAGLDFRPEIEKAMSRAAVAVLMISADFLASDFITKEEVPLLLQRRETSGLRVIPVIVEPCLWKHVKWLKGIQARPTDGRPLSLATDAEAKADLAAIAEEIVGIIEEAGGARE